MHIERMSPQQRRDRAERIRAEAAKRKRNKAKWDAKWQARVRDAQPARPEPLRDTCGWCTVAQHSRCQRVYVYERHTVRCVCAAALHGILHP